MNLYLNMSPCHSHCFLADCIWDLTIQCFFSGAVLLALIEGMGIMMSRWQSDQINQGMLTGIPD